MTISLELSDETLIAQIIYFIKHVFHALVIHAVGYNKKLTQAEKVSNQKYLFSYVNLYKNYA